MSIQTSILKCHLQLSLIFFLNCNYLFKIQYKYVKTRFMDVIRRQPHKMVKHTQTICWQQTTNCLSVFDRFVGLALKGLRMG